jgi:transposase InsO family protein
MDIEALSRMVPLPKDWPHQVKAAVLQALSLISTATSVRQGHRSNSSLTAVRQEAEREAQADDLALSKEEIAILSARMSRIRPSQRPDYLSTERMRILQVRAARRWSLAETARHFQVEPETISAWMRRLNEDGDHALVKLTAPLNKYPAYVRYMVQRVRQLIPSMGKKQIAQFFARAGLHLGVSTVGRMLKESPCADDPPCEMTTADEPASDASAVERVVTARHPHHVWHADLTTVPTRLGWWLAWLPFSLPQMGPFGWYVLVVVDHFTRQVVGMEAFRKEPTSWQVRKFLGRLIARVGRAPRHIVTDRGPQFDCCGFRTWCKRRKIRWRYGAVGRYGSIAVVERFIRSLKEGWLRIICVPYQPEEFRQLLEVYAAWYNQHRPHQARGGQTPAEVAHGVIPMRNRPRYEPRSGLSGGDHVIGQPGDRIEFRVIPFRGHRQLPVIELKLAA